MTLNIVKYDNIQRHLSLSSHYFARFICFLTTSFVIMDFIAESTGLSFLQRHLSFSCFLFLFILKIVALLSIEGTKNLFVFLQPLFSV